MSDEENYSNENEINDKQKGFHIPEECKTNSKNLFLLFMFTFVSVVIFSTMFFKGLFSNVDVNIGENPVAAMDQRGDEEEDMRIRSQIDQRLRMIQNEEEMPGVSERSYETDEEIVERLRRDETKINNQKDDSIREKQEEKTKQTLETVSLSTETQNTNSNSISKIYIGQFSDIQKAIEMQTNILNSGLDVNPIIKEINGYYTIQVGAFSSYESARALSDKINNAGFSAKIVREIK